jgi:hypothetical protein
LRNTFKKKIDPCLSKPLIRIYTVKIIADLFNNAHLP